jgi:prepilin-type N-terminal cleavage/methylation domain-containing protein
MGPVQGRAAALARRGGFTLIELLVVVCVVAVLFGVALDRLLRYQELAERTALEQNLAAINVALTSKFAALIVAGRGEAIAQEAGANPVHLLVRAPENYLGELYAPAPDSLPRRSWYFDRQSGELVYVPGRTRYLTAGAGQERGLRFRVLLSEPAASSVAAGLRELRQPYVAARAPYRWVIE